MYMSYSYLIPTHLIQNCVPNDENVIKFKQYFFDVEMRKNTNKQLYSIGIME